MTNKEVILDRLAGGLMLYVENYTLAKNKNNRNKLKLGPSYAVDYEIAPEVLELLQESCKGSVSEVWYHQISGCQDINELPEYLKNLVIQYLPRFFEEYPEYADDECLRIL